MVQDSQRFPGSLQVRTCAHTDALDVGAVRWCRSCGALEGPGGWKEPRRAALLRASVEVVRSIVAITDVHGWALLDAATAPELPPRDALATEGAGPRVRDSNVEARGGLSRRAYAEARRKRRDPRSSG